MQLMIQAVDAADLSRQIKNLALILNCEASQIPLPIAQAPVVADAPVTPEEKPIGLVKEEAGPDIKATEEKPAKGKGKGGGRGKGKGAKANQEKKSMNGEPEATINWPEKKEDENLEPNNDPDQQETPSTPSTEPKTTPAKERGEVTKQMVADACQKVSTEKNLDTARKLLGEFKASSGEACRRISELQAEDYAAFVDKCEKAVNG